jgi:hypothetical protein
MKTGRQGGFVLLAIMVLWTVLPASACILAHHAMARPACCRAMKDCDSPAMGADSSCCQIRGNGVAVASVLPYSNDDHGQQLAAATYLVGMQLPVAEIDGSSSTFNTPPPKFPPGGAFALRI